MKNRSKKIMVILAIVIVLIIASIVIPMIVKGDNNSAQKAQVLSSKTFTSDVAGVAVQGGMQNFGDAVLTKQVDAEGEDYIATIDLDDGYYESVQINAKPIYDRGVAAGVGNIPRLTNSNFSGTHSSTSVGAASNYTVKSTSAGYVENNTTVATLAAQTLPEIATTSATGVQTINIKPGYYNKIKVNQTAAYDAGVTAGTNSLTGGNATAAQILKDKTAYVSGKLVTGTMVNNGKVTKTINPGGSYTIPAGYHNGQGTVTANANQNSGTYTFASGSTGGKTDMGANNTYRYVDATNVYNKGKADGTTASSINNAVISSTSSISTSVGDVGVFFAYTASAYGSTISMSGCTILKRYDYDGYDSDDVFHTKHFIAFKATSSTVTASVTGGSGVYAGQWKEPTFVRFYK